MSEDPVKGGLPSGPQSDVDSANKRAALAGQWRTPPTQAYPSGYSAPAPHPAPVPGPVPGSNTSLPSTSSIPSNSDDYAKALQEAYRKGAEAAARMAHQQQQQQQEQIPPSVSCPNFSASEDANVTATATYPMHAAPTSIPDPLASSSMPPPPPQVPHAYASSSAVQPVAPTDTHLSMPPGSVPPSTQPQSGHAMTTAMSVSHHPSHPQSSAYAADPKSQQQARSLSMPDMATYAAQAEEEKRQKRLARNRASARLRRLRKKNLVEAYETEVGILEKTLKQLQAHEWGTSDDHQALLEAIGMERGQQAIPPDQRANIIRDILRHQQEQVEVLQQAQMEQECLARIATDPDDELSRELQEVLQLSEEQKGELKTSSEGLEEEIQALETIATSLQAMRDNDWLLNEGVTQIADQFTSILHKNQLSKFMLWTDANIEAIDQLDHVTVQPLEDAPLFSFGVETSPDNEKEE